ncbi:MAG: hypothetical protein AAF561_07745, partial [Planctomycetota bacterium]
PTDAMPRARPTSSRRTGRLAATEAIADQQVASAERHTHRIEVETGDEPVHVTVGQPTQQTSHTTTPGGFSKFFNRVIDNGLWSALTDPARTVYLPLVRLADSRPPHRSKVGVASLIRMTGLSRSSVKRGLKALQEQRLITVISQGGVGADGKNRPNVYELIVPEPRDPEGVQARTHSRSKGERTSGSRKARPAVQEKAGPGFPAEPHLRDISKTNTPRSGVGGGFSASPTPDADPESQRLAEMLGRWGFEPAEAIELLAESGAAAASRAMDDARQLDAGGKLRCATGFIRWRLREEAKSPNDAPPRDGGRGDNVSDASLIAPSRQAGPSAVAAEIVSASAASRKPRADDQLPPRGDRTNTEADPSLIAFDQLPADVVDWAAARVAELHADRPAMLRLLTSKPPAASPLMRAEIAKLLAGDRGSIGVP